MSCALFEQVSQTAMQPSGVSIAHVYAKHGVQMIPANNDRVPGWQRLREYLSDQADGQPALIYFENCKEAIRTIPTLVHDTVRVEDLVVLTHAGARNLNRLSTSMMIEP